MCKVSVVLLALMLALLAAGCGSASRTPARHFVLIDAKTGKVDYPPDIKGGGIDAAVADGHGGWYIAGDFKRVGKVRRPSLAHLNPDGTLDRSFSPDLPAGIAPYGFDTLAVGARRVFVGPSLGSQVFALDGRTGRRLWAVSSSWPDLAFGNGVLYVAPQLPTRPTEVRNEPIAALDPATGKPTAWRVSGWSREPAVESIAVTRRTVYFGGQFTKVGGVRVSCSVVGVSAKTGRTTWVPRKTSGCGTGGTVGSIFVSRGQLLTTVVPPYDWMGVDVISFFTAFDIHTRRILPWTKPVPRAAPLAVSGNTVYIGGSPSVDDPLHPFHEGFWKIGKARVDNLAAVSLSSGILENWFPNLGKCNSVWHAAVSGQKVLVVGRFTPRTCKALGYWAPKGSLGN